jgi:hypothetical protein
MAVVPTDREYLMADQFVDVTLPRACGLRAYELDFSAYRDVLKLEIARLIHQTTDSTRAEPERGVGSAQ